MTRTNEDDRIAGPPARFIFMLEQSSFPPGGIL